MSIWIKDSAYINILVEELDLKTVSFTYGASHPTFSPWPGDDDWKEYLKIYIHMINLVIIISMVYRNIGITKGKL